MGTTAEELSIIDKQVVRNGPTLTIQQQRELIVVCTTHEVRSALFSMGSNNSPGIDGFNVYFFKKCWNIIGDEVTAAVQQFFLTSYPPREINVALLTLLPKCDNASTMKNFRPIACCTILYKVISKVLANRLKGVLNSIVGDSQSAFVKGRLILDNVMLSQELITGYTRKHVSPRCMLKVDIQKAYDSVEWVFLK